MEQHHHLPLRKFWQSIALSIIVLVTGTAIQIAQTAAAYNIRIFRTWSSGWIPLFAVLFTILISALAFLVVLSLPVGRRLAERLDVVSHLHPGWRIAGIIGFLVWLPVFSLVVIQPFFSRFLDGGWTRAAMFFLLSLMGMISLKIGRSNLSWLAALGLAALLYAIFYNLVVNFAIVNNYPFSLAWSDVSRYYGASLFLAERIYGSTPPQAVLHPAYHLLILPPFLAGNPPIWIHRLWQVLLQVGLTAALVHVFLKRLGVRRATVGWIAACWAYLYLMQGPIQSHLLLCALVVFWGVAPERYWRTTIVVLLASLWAGWCRINWFPVPGMLAAALFILEMPLGSSGNRAVYFWKPASWFLAGTAVAFASNLFFMRWSGNGTGGNFVSSLNSELFWYRLLPNSTYSNGVLPEILLVSLPMVLILLISLRGSRGVFCVSRLVVLFAMLAVLFLGGLVVSVKIGGGYGLHNLDAYLVMLMLLTGYIYANRAAPDHISVQRSHAAGIGLIALALAVPIWFAIQYTPAIKSWDQERAERVRQLIKFNAEEVASQGEEVLFVSQRHLMAFDRIDVPLVPEYEQDFLMEMVMSHNRPYLDQFQADLSAQRFGLIFIYPQAVFYDSLSEPFSEESNYWTDEVTVPLLCYYEPVFTFDEFKIASYVPRDQACK